MTTNLMLPLCCVAFTFTAAACASDSERDGSDASSDAATADTTNELDAATDAVTDTTVDVGGATGGQFFPNGHWAYDNIEDAPVRADSDTTTSWLVDQGGWGVGRMQIDFSIIVLQADGDTARRAFIPTDDHFTPDCDEIPVPVPDGGALEGEEGYACDNDGDCHLIVVDDSTDQLFEMWRADIRGDTFNGGCLAVWDMTQTYPDDGRGEQCTSADAAGFPIAPLLFYAEEVAAGEINHAIRFILPNERMQAGVYVRPATHAGGPRADAPAPIYGSRWRLRADYPLESLPNDGARVVARAMQQYGMVLSDGGNIALTAADDRFSDVSWEGLLGPRDLDTIQPSDFEIIDTGPSIELTYDCTRTPLR